VKILRIVFQRNFSVGVLENREIAPAIGGLRAVGEAHAVTMFRRGRDVNHDAEASLHPN